MSRTVSAKIDWKQTFEERYETDVNERARAAVEALGITVDGTEGGCGLEGDDGALPGDHRLYVTGPVDALDAVPEALRFILEYPETVTVTLAPRNLMAALRASLERLR